MNKITANTCIFFQDCKVQLIPSFSLSDVQHFEKKKKVLASRQVQIFLKCMFYPRNIVFIPELYFVAIFTSCFLETVFVNHALL